MRIIRTGGIIPRTPAPPRVGKGWVREGILNNLSAQPSTVTELARALGVSKSTASYHLSLLLGKGVVEVVDTGGNPGMIQMKKFGLKQGSFVTVLTRSEEEAELGRLRETFDLHALAWERSAAAMDLEQLQGLLYGLFLHLFRISRSEHATLLRDYGNRAGAAFSSRIPSVARRELLACLTSELGKSRISDSDLLEVPGSPISVVVSNRCIGSSFHPSNACYFLEGMIEGSVRTRLGHGVKVGRIAVPGVPSCIIAIGRMKRFDRKWLAEAILSSSSYAAIGRGHGGRSD